MGDHRAIGNRVSSLRTKSLRTLVVGTSVSPSPPDLRIVLSSFAAGVPPRPLRWNAFPTPVARGSASIDRSRTTPASGCRSGGGRERYCAALRALFDTRAGHHDQDRGADHEIERARRS